MSNLNGYRNSLSNSPCPLGRARGIATPGELLKLLRGTGHLRPPMAEDMSSSVPHSHGPRRARAFDQFNGLFFLANYKVGAQSFHFKYSDSESRVAVCRETFTAYRRRDFGPGAKVLLLGIILPSYCGPWSQ